MNSRLWLFTIELGDHIRVKSYMHIMELFSYFLFFSEQKQNVSIFFVLYNQWRRPGCCGLRDPANETVEQKEKVFKKIALTTKITQGPKICSAFGSPWILHQTGKVNILCNEEKKTSTIGRCQKLNNRERIKPQSKLFLL